MMVLKPKLNRLCVKSYFLSSETDLGKQKMFKTSKIQRRSAEDKLFFLFGKDAQCLEKIRHILKKKKPDKILLDMGHLTQNSLALLKSLGLTLKPVGSNTYIVESQLVAA